MAAERGSEVLSGWYLLELFRRGQSIDRMRSKIRMDGDLQFAEVACHLALVDVVLEAQVLVEIAGAA